MSGSSFTSSLGDIMLKTIQKVVETPGTMLGEHDFAWNGHLQNSFYHPMYICHVKCVNHHLHCFTTPTFVLHTGWSPLKISNCNGQNDVMKVLMKSGANIYQANEVTTHICSVIVIHSHKI